MELEKSNISWIYQSLDKSKIDLVLKSNPPPRSSVKIIQDCDSDAFLIHNDDFKFNSYKVWDGKIPSFVSEKNLVPVLTIDEDFNLLMMAWSNEESLNYTFENKRGTYYSRSRKKLWIKGEESGHIQNIIQIKVSNDSKSFIYIVDQVGVACHTGARSCFFTAF
jgi:phosphoribosyl-AMP cyclohydrolase